MRVYLAAAMTNQFRNVSAVAALLAHIEGSGHEVPTRHVADPLGKKRDADLSDVELAKRDLAWVNASDAVIAEVSAPSHGVGVEVYAASQRHIPVLLLYGQGVAVSRLLLGLPGVEAFCYRGPAEACATVDAFLAGVAASLTAARPRR